MLLASRRAKWQQRLKRRKRAYSNHYGKDGGTQPSPEVLSSLLLQCVDVEVVRHVHSHILKNGLEAPLADQLVTTYIRFGCLGEAHRVLDRNSCLRFGTWSEIITGYAQNGQRAAAFFLFRKMQQDGMIPNKFMLVRVLSSACSSLEQGKLAHSCLLEMTSGSDRVGANAGISMYRKFGCVEAAKAVFDEVSERDIITWTLMVSVYAEGGHSREAFRLFAEMLADGVVPNKVSFLALLSACSSLSQARFVHRLLSATGFLWNGMVESSLIDAYGRCKSLDAASEVFRLMSDTTNVAAWNSLIRAFSNTGDATGALETFRKLLLQGLAPDRVTFINASQGPRTHPEAIFLEACRGESGALLDVALGNALVNMFGRCKYACEARRVFDATHSKSIVSWNAMLSAYSQNGHSEETVNLFHQMTVKPDKLTFASVLSACANLENLVQGKLAHERAAEAGLELAAPVAATLIQMYSRCRCLEKARDLFDRIASPDVVAWTVMMAAYAGNGHPEDAIALFFSMTVAPDNVAFVVALGACTSAGNLEAGEAIQARVVGVGLENRQAVANAVLDLYGKCAEVDETARFFGGMKQRDGVTWNTMVAAYARAGDVDNCVRCFCVMQLQGLKPSEATFVSVLSAYSHAGLVKQGCECFAAVNGDYGMAPSAEQQGCVVDLVGRAGWLDSGGGGDLLDVLPSKPSAEQWTALLNACNMHSDVERARCAAASVLEMDPDSDSAHITLFNIYASSF